METISESDDPYLIWQDLYMKGDDLQKISVIQALPSLLQADNNGTITRIIPKIQQELPTSSSEFHLVTSEIFKVLMQMNLPINLLRPVLQGIESKDPTVSNAWIETLLSVILHLSDSAIKRDVLPFAITMSQLNKSALYRIASCKILGQIAIHPHLSAFDVKKDILPVVQSLCQDCYHEVRSSMCYELPNIAKGLGSDNLVKSSLLPSLVELSSDENVSVRAVAVDATVLMIPYLNQETVKQTIIPLIKQLCVQSMKSSEITFSVISRMYGQLIINLQQNLTSSEGQWFLNFFMQLSKKGLSLSPEEIELDPGLEVTCREYCAYNLPAITLFVTTKLQSDLGIWYQIFKSLAADPCYIVRKTVAGCIHEVAKILGNDSRYIMMDFVKLLRDDSEEVLDSLVPNIAGTLEQLCMAGVLSRDSVTPGTLEVSRALLKCQSDVFRFHNWRRKTNFLKQLECLPNVMESDFIHQHFTSVVLKLMISGRARPVRSQASRTVLVFLRYNLKENHRKWIREKLISMLCCSPCSYTRHIFLCMCQHAVDIFSTRYFKEYFFLHLVKLIEDPVATVRLGVVNLCPVLKNMCTSTVDRNYQMKLEHTVARLEMVETDREVTICLKNKLKEMRSLQIIKQDVLLEEKRRIDEEDRVQQGKLPPPKIATTAPSRPAKEASQKMMPVVQAATITTKRIATPTSKTPTSEMSFLGQHFYIDAGVVLSEKIQNVGQEDVAAIEDKVMNLELEDGKKVAQEEVTVSTISLENTNVQNMSDDDLKELETSTTNITDDVKADIQKKTLCTVSRSRTTPDTVKRRNKRYSCSFASDESQTNIEVLKRRSLNIGPHESSRIPISFRSVKKFEGKSNLKRSKSGVISSSGVEKRVGMSRLKSTTAVDNKINVKDKSADTDEVDVKENVPMLLATSSINVDVPNRCNKVSNLPILVRRIQSDLKK